MIKLSEIIPFVKSQQIKTGLEKKYGPDELKAYTFGIELEYIPEQDINFEKIRLELENDDRVHLGYRDWVYEKRNELNKRIHRVDQWDDSFGPIDLDTYDSIVDRPDKSDYNTDEEYESEFNKYVEERSKIDVDYERWERRDFDDYFDYYIGELIDNDEWENYVNVSDISDIRDRDGEINQTIDYIKNDMGQEVSIGDSGKDKWGVGLDGDNIEIRSKHLNQNEFDLVRSICDYVRNKDVSGGTSAHVHIGLPSDFDVFDLLAITTLVDENAIKDTVGPGRELSRWAKLRDSLHSKIVNVLLNSEANRSTNEKSFVVTHKYLLSLLSGLGRYWGTNIAAMSHHKTIEFRYLGSQLTRNPELFIKWIKYYLLLPKIAKSRNILVLKQNIGQEDSQSVTVIRLSNGVKFILNSRGSTPNLPSSDLKKGDVPVVSPKIAQAKQNALSKIKI